MKRIYVIFALLLSAGFLIGCDSFLDTENLTKKDTSNFPKTEVDARQMVAAIYTVMNNGIEKPESDPFFVFEMASDDRLGGGSQSNVGAQGCDRLMNWEISAFEKFWETRYAGIFRANSALATIENVTDWSSEKVKDQLISEIYFLRAFYYFQLVQIFGEVPLVVNTVAQNLPKSPADEIYAQIASDLIQAINVGPAVKWPDFEIGHATKWVAEAIMARVWLFYTGFYKKSELPTVDGGSVTKAQVVAWLEDCIANSGHALVSDQRNLWPYTNPYTAKDYPYAVDNGLVWATDENIENMFAVKFANKGSHSTGELRHNRIVEYFGVRKSTAGAFPFTPQGYSNGPVCTTIWTDWGADPDYAGDYRRIGSICERATEIPEYAGDKSKEVENTGYLSKKYLGCGAYDEAGTLITSYAFFYGGENDKQKGLTQSLVWLRFADVLLMHAELTDGKAVYNGKNGLNAVRSRAKLNDVAYTLDALKKERRYELCFEALRWNDLRRWGDVSVIPENQKDLPILNEGKEGKYAFTNDFMARYNATGGGFFKLPDSQITLSEGVLVQNPGWEEQYDHNKGDLPYFKK